MARRCRLALAAAFFVGATAGYAAADVRVVASIQPVHSLVSAVMDGVGEPLLIMRGASSPHTFSMRPSDAAMIEDAQVVFMIAHEMEVSLVRPLAALVGDARVVELALAPGIVLLPLREGATFAAHDEGEEHSEEDEEHEHGAFETHVWLDPVYAGEMARAIAGTLSEVDPDNAATYAANAEALLLQLDDLTAEVYAALTPSRGWPFIVFHNAYRYFEVRFDLASTGAIAVSSAQMPGVRRIVELRNTVRELGTVCVLAEPQFDSGIVRTITEGTPARTGVIDPVGAAIESGPELYFTLLRDMVASFRDCLRP